MKKVIKCLGIAIVFVMIFSACNFDTLNFDDIQCYYNNSEYDLYDNHGNYANTCWNIPSNIQTQKVKVYLGSNSDLDKKPNQTATVYTNFGFEMFLYFNHDLYCDTSYDFPYYNSEIEKIVFLTDDNDDFFASNNINIVNKEDISIIQDLLVSASEKNNWENNFNKRKKQDSNIYIGIKFKNFDAILYYGYFSLDEKNNYGISCYNVDSEDCLYAINADVLKIFDKYSLI